MSCPTEPIPAGWRVWRQPVPPALTQFAVDALGRIKDSLYGSITATMVYNGEVVGAFKSHHTFTTRNGVLMTGLCIPGISLLHQPTGIATTVVADDLTTPDPNAAVFSEGPSSPNWGLVAVSGIAIVGVVGLFLLALHAAPTPRSKPKWRHRIPRAY